MLSGIYAEPNTSAPVNNFFSESLEYDVNGNITKLYRNAKNSNGLAEQIDKLGYIYAGNQLITVNDTSTNYRGYPDVSGNTIAYDDNGNMTSQKDKGILKIGYNFLNLPSYLEFDKQYFTRGRWLNVNTNYTYRADGTKLKKVYKYSEGSVFKQKTTEYIDGFQYEIISTSGDPLIKFVPTSEGYFNFENNKYIYNYTDHLRNVRVSYFNNGSGAEVLEENNYYPFGLKHEGYNALAGNALYQYKYNGKEVQTETGWNDYGWRQYMPEIGRWNGIDQLAEAYLSTSPYAYVANNPISSFDVDGRWFNRDGDIDTSGYSSGFIRPKKAFITQFLGKDPGDGGGNNVINFTNASAFGFLQDILTKEGGIGAMFSLVEQLKEAGFKDPANDKANYMDKNILLEKIPALNELFKITGAEFMENNNITNSAETVGKVVYLKMSDISSLLSFAYTLGHEMNHVFDNRFFKDKFSEITNNYDQRSNPFLKSFGFFKETAGLSWEMQIGNTKWCGLNGYESASFYYGPNGLDKYSQGTINNLNPYMGQLNWARQIIYNAKKKELK